MGNTQLNDAAEMELKSWVLDNVESFECDCDGKYDSGNPHQWISTESGSVTDILNIVAGTEWRQWITDERKRRDEQMPGPDITIDFSTRAKKWLVKCDEHGEVWRSNVLVGEFDRVTEANEHDTAMVVASAHDVIAHGGSGKIPVNTLMQEYRGPMTGLSIFGHMWLFTYPDPHTVQLEMH